MLFKKLKYKELELEFSQQVSELKAEVDEKISCDKEKEQEAKENEHLLSLVTYSPRVAIMEAWIELETAAVELTSSIWNEPNKDMFRSMPKLGEYLYKSKIFDATQLKIFNKLRQLRNKSAQAAELNLHENDVKSYVQMAVNLTNYIRCV